MRLGDAGATQQDTLCVSLVPAGGLGARLEIPGPVLTESSRSNSSGPGFFFNPSYFGFPLKS